MRRLGLGGLSGFRVSGLMGRRFRGLVGLGFGGTLARMVGNARHGKSCFSLSRRFLLDQEASADPAEGGQSGSLFYKFLENTEKIENILPY